MVKIYCLYLEEVQVMCMIKCQKEKLKKKQELCNQQHSMHNGISVEEKACLIIIHLLQRKINGQRQRNKLIPLNKTQLKHPQNFKRVYTFKLSKLSIKSKGNSDLTEKENKMSALKPVLTWKK